MGSRIYKHHGRAQRTQRQKKQRIMNIVTLIFILCVGILILGVYGVLPLPQFLALGQVEISGAPNQVAQQEIQEPVEEEPMVEQPVIKPETEQTEFPKEEIGAEAITPAEAEKIETPAVENSQPENTETELENVETSENIPLEPEQLPIVESTVEMNGVDPTKPMLALTFDDGPSKYTWPILAALDSVQGRATFFVVGNRIPTHHAALQQIKAVKCEIGNHSYSHPDLTKLTTADMQAQVKSTDDALEKVLGIRTALLRPPYGAVSPTLFSTVDKPLIFWSVDPKDWENRDKDYLVSYLLETVQDGDIVLLHDIHETTALACQELIPKLVEQGYQLVTVSEMFAAKQIELIDGQIYRGRTFEIE